ncbi:MAG: DUF2784 domain-containing protein [Candidatus Binataceae bacterium]
MAYLILADLVAIVHAAYVLFVLIGLVLIVAGIAKGWQWVRGFWFRVAHLLAIAIVCAQWLARVACPLTILENRLREMGGATGYAHDFVAYWVDWLIFYNLPPWIFTVAYPGLGVVIAALFIIAPPRWPYRDRLSCTRRK